MDSPHDVCSNCGAKRHQHLEKRYGRAATGPVEDRKPVVVLECPPPKRESIFWMNDDAQKAGPREAVEQVAAD